IKTELVQVPSAQNGNVAICLAEVATEKGSFTGIGDADPSNVNRMMVNALIRLAETRAKARALRDAVNVAMIAIEELSESAPEMLLLDELAEAGRPEAPAPIVSLASVRQHASGGLAGPVPHVVVDDTSAPGAATTPAAPVTPAAVKPVEPVRLPAARTTARAA